MPWRKAVTRCGTSESDVLRKKPTNATAGCCARAASGHAAAAPPSSVMNSRRFIRSPRRRGRAAWRHFEAERFGGLEVDHQLVFGRRLHRQVGRLLALEDAIDVAGREAVLVDDIRPIGDQAAVGDELAAWSRPRAICAGPPAR